MTDEQPSPHMQPRPAREPIFMLPPLIMVLAGVMLVIQALNSFVLGNDAQLRLVTWFGFIPARLVFPDQFPGGLWPLLWTPLTYGFLHGGWWHVLSNVIWLVIFGTPVARRYGAGPTLLVFFVSSVVGAIAFGITEYTSVAYLVGASGGIAGLTGAAMRFIFQPVLFAPGGEGGAPVPVGRRMASVSDILRTPAARNFSLLWIILNCLVPLAPMIVGEQVEVAWQAHLGGFFTGLLLVPFFDRGHNDQRL